MITKQPVFREKDLGDEFMRILQEGDIKTVFQPIISLKNGELLGYEALSRGPSNSVFNNPEKLFDFARVYGRLWELEFLCRIKALENMSKNDSSNRIFLNVDPHIIDDEKFKKGFTKDFLKEFNIDPKNVVFEITEKNSVVDIQSFKKIIENYKDQGYSIAIDDTGSGYSGLKLITDIHPHFIKLDMNLIRDIDKDGLKYALIKTFHDFCQVTDIKLVAEGIETENELNSLIEIGIDYGQGYFIQRPAEKLGIPDDKLVSHIKARNEKKKELYLNKPAAVFVGDICRKSISVKSSDHGASILEIFSQNPTLLGLPVVDEGRLTGLVMRDKFYAKLGTQYGFALYVNRPVKILMDNRPLIVDYETTIDNVSKMAMARAEENLYDYIVVVKDSMYYGMVTVKDLLEKTTELEVNFARHLNPLTGLPGNMLIEQKLRSVLSGNKPFTILYMDIDNFKAYNDIYGFEKGDRVLQYFSEILTGCFSVDKPGNSFIGHIGGDDFIMIVESFETEEICEQIIKMFDNGRLGFYSKEDAEKGYILNRNRHGIWERFGLISLSIAGISNKEKKYGDIYELTEYSSRIKKKCKEIEGSCYLIG